MFSEGVAVFRGINQDSVSGWPSVIHYLVNNSKLISYVVDVYNYGSDLLTNQYIILFQLLYCGGEAKYKELEKRLYLAQSCIAIQLNNLQEMGLVTNKCNETYRDGKSAYLTEEGERIAKTFMERMKNGENIACKKFSEEDKEKFIVLLKRTWDLFEKY